MNNPLKSNKSIEAALLSFSTAENVDNAANKTLTNGVEVVVLPEFLTSQSGLMAEELFIWNYQIRIANKRPGKIKLISRHFKIIDENGKKQIVDGEGVVGKQPEIEAGAYFEYGSAVHLACPSGIMSGYYEMIDENGSLFNVEIPSFSLDAPYKKNIIN